MHEDTDDDLPPLADSTTGEDNGDEDIDMESGLQDVLDAVKFLSENPWAWEKVEKLPSRPAARPKPLDAGTSSSTRAPAKPRDGQTSLEDMSGAVWTSRARTAAPAAEVGEGKTTHQTTLDAYRTLESRMDELDKELTQVPLPKAPSPQVPSPPKGPSIGVTCPDLEGHHRRVATPLAHQVTSEAGLKSLMDLMVYIWDMSPICKYLYIYIYILVGKIYHM